MMRNLPTFVLLCTASTTAVSVAERVDFDRQIRRILSQHCFHCHGPDAKHREAGLPLDEVKSATAELESGETAIVPGKPGESAVIARIFSTDEDELMPPPDANRIGRLTAGPDQTSTASCDSVRSDHRPSPAGHVMPACGVARLGDSP